jgi:hypothetical protein
MQGNHFKMVPKVLRPFPSFPGADRSAASS